MSASKAAMSRAALSVLLTICCCPVVYPQNRAPNPPYQTLDGRSSKVLDGGSRQVLESIVIPDKTNSPFLATLHTEWVRGSSESGTITLVNNRRIARDSSGRIYQERWLLVPKNRNDDSEMNAKQISDPNQHTLYTCVFLREPKICTLTYYSPSTSVIYHA